MICFLSSCFEFFHKSWVPLQLKKNFVAPFYGWGSTGSRLQSHFEKAVYFLLLSSQKSLVPIWSTWEGWKAESTVESNLIILFFNSSLDPCAEIPALFSHWLYSSLLISWVIFIAANLLVYKASCLWLSCYRYCVNL